MTARVVGIAVMHLAALTAEAQTAWPLWNAFTKRFLSADGRVIDHDAAGRTTSEGQAYGMFFALVARDRERFDLMLRWTINNLCRGDLAANLPAWRWGETPEGSYNVLDANSASDADLWLAYTLLEAGRLWESDSYASLAASLARNIAKAEVAVLPGYGPMLLPGARGFALGANTYKLNPSYVPPQVVLRMAQSFPEGPWAALYDGIPALWRESRVEGFVPDWTVWKSGAFSRHLAGESGKASYDAIRVYLWAGMLHPETPRRAELLETVSGMVSRLQRHELPPEEVTAGGIVKDSQPGAGFSAAVVPLLLAVAEKRALAAQRRRIAQEFDSETKLYGCPARYYDQCLLLFSLGWVEERYRFGRDGRLIVTWRFE